jgi:UDP-N-acetylglucosamine 2-epimerase (non-hydrolysing)
MTAHRRESFGAPLREAFGAVVELVDRYPDVVVLYPVHPNPNVLDAANEILGDVDRVLLTEPLDYLDLVNGLKRAVFALTDSGGIQEEAPTFGTPVLVLRDVTERPEGVQAGAAVLVGTNRERILAEAARVLDHPLDRTATRPPNPYGDGHAGERIADVVRHLLTGAPRSRADWDPEA